MARKQQKSCSPHLIRFKTRRGKTVQFHGRSAGTTRHGGACKPKAATGAQRHQRALIAKAGRACARRGRPGTRANVSCLREAFRA